MRALGRNRLTLSLYRCRPQPRMYRIVRFYPRLHQRELVHPIAKIVVWSAKSGAISITIKGAKTVAGIAKTVSTVPTKDWTEDRGPQWPTAPRNRSRQLGGFSQSIGGYDQTGTTEFEGSPNSVTSCRPVIGDNNFESLAHRLAPHAHRQRYRRQLTVRDCSPVRSQRSSKPLHTKLGLCDNKAIVSAHRPALQPHQQLRHHDD